MRLTSTLLLLMILVITPSVVAASEGRICFTRGDYIFIRESNGGTKRLVKGYSPRISPDGRTVAFVEVKGELLKSESHVRLIDIQTGKVRTLSKLNQFKSFSPVWSPDGRKLAVEVVMGNLVEVAIVDATSEELYVIPANLRLEFIWLNSWTADGRSIVLNSLEHVYQVRLDGQVLRKLAIRDLFGTLIISSESRFSFSPDGRFLLFNTSMVPDDVGISAIYRYDFANERLSRLTSDPLGGRDPQWLTDKEIVFTGYVKGRYKPKSCVPYYRIYRMSGNGKNRRVVIRDAENASYSLSR